jgi:hypothetical protein
MEAQAKRALPERRALQVPQENKEILARRQTLEPLGQVGLRELLPPSPDRPERLLTSPDRLERLLTSPDRLESRRPSQDRLERLLTSPDPLEHLPMSPDLLEHLRPSPDQPERLLTSPDRLERRLTSPDRLERSRPSQDRPERLLTSPVPQDNLELIPMYSDRLAKPGHMVLNTRSFPSQVAPTIPPSSTTFQPTSFLGQLSKTSQLPRQTVDNGSRSLILIGMGALGIIACLIRNDA